ncbi:hypothetical protein NUW58_g590 [Xylaria curta]|uniref:Uncharacterized protein n=1 Tax=Xylaria curta TaxID=42375 RepID=A0ACC1PQ30_9PEZI|nr:hypothetical protein NUW58_g590 [Xylaria curta]
MADEDGWWSYHRGTWNTTKFVLRCISFALSIVVIGLSVETGIRVSNWSAFSFYDRVDWWFTLPVTLLSIILDCSELALSVVRKRNPAVPPGWHIGLELVLFGGNLVALVFIGSIVPPEGVQRLQTPFPGGVRPLRIAMLTVLGIFTTVRFILFVIACVDTHRYHTAAQVELIVQALRRQNLDDPTAGATIPNSAYLANYIRNPQHPRGPPYWPAQMHSDESPLYPELPENQKFLAAELRRAPTRYESSGSKLTKASCLEI